jgi:hypothetical protein
MSSNCPFLKFIEANLFQGLNYLNDLHLNALNVDATLNDSSFNYLSNIGNIYLDWNIVTKYQCLFMNAIVHDVRRKVGERYKFFKSINLLTFDIAENECELTFRLFQVKIHLNLKSDLRNELFYEKCKESILSNENSYENNNLKCASSSNRLLKYGKPKNINEDIL